MAERNKSTARPAGHSRAHSLRARGGVRSSCPRRTGYMEVLYGHAPLMAELGAGDVIVHGGGSEADGAAALQRELGLCRGAAATASRFWPTMR